MPSSFDFSGKKYLVTGASSGLGKKVSEMLASCGAQVLTTARNRNKLEDLANNLSNGNHLFFPKDLMDDDYTDLFEYALSNGWKLDGIVHCAGVSPILPVGSLTRERVDDCMTTNFFSFLELMRLFSKRKYRSEKGSVVAVSSISSLYPDKCQTLYAASKAALNTAVQGLALELNRSNVRVNVVLPGSMDTEMTRDAVAEGRIDNIERKLSKQILGLSKPEDVANVILFLLSDLASAITGRTIFADGGYINF